MIRGYKYRPLTEIYSMIIVYSYRPGSFLKVLRFSTIPNIRLLAFIPYMKPVSSIFYRSAYIIFSIAGKLKSGNQACIALTVALSIRVVSMRWVWRVLIYGLQYKKLSSQCFPTPIAEPPAKKTRLANIRIYVYVGATPRASCTRIHSANRLSYTGDSFWQYIYASVLGCRPVLRCCKVASGML